VSFDFILDEETKNEPKVRKKTDIDAWFKKELVRALNRARIAEGEDKVRRSVVMRRMFQSCEVKIEQAIDRLKQEGKLLENEYQNFADATITTFRVIN